MQEVSAKTLPLFADMLRARGLDPLAMLRGVPLDAGLLERPKGMIDWSLYCEVLEKVTALCGGQQALDEAFAEALAAGQRFLTARKLFGMCVSVSQLYWMSEHWFGPSLFPCIPSSQRALPDGRIEQRLEIPEPLRPSETFFRLNVAALRVVPCIVGKPEAIIHAELTPRTALITITPPPSLTIWSGLPRLLRVLSGSPTALDELGAQQQQVKQSFDELRQAHDRISRQADQLRTINDLGRELAEHVDLPELGRVVAGMLRMRLGLQAVALWVSDRPGAEPRLLETQGARPGPPARALALVAGQRRLGTLEIWGSGLPRGELGPSLLDELVPWIAIALHNALAFAEVERARDTLEQRVVERTAELRETASKLEDALHERERVDAERTRFFANASHELRTPLTLLLPVLEELRLRPELSRDHQTAVEHALRSGYRMARLVNDLLDLSKLEAGALRLFPTPVELAALVRRTLEPWLGPLERRGVQVELALDELPPLALDGERLESVAWNLYANAARFVPDGGRVTVSLAQRGDRIVWAVANSGPRIPEDDLAQIFDRFGQASDSPMRRYGTTGLGLAMVKEIASLHGGGVAAANVPEGGVRFDVWLPAREHRPGACVGQAPAPDPRDLNRFFSPELASRPSSPTARGAADAHGSAAATADVPASPEAADEGEPAQREVSLPRLLVVEDHDELRAELARMLGRDYTVLQAADGLEGLRLCRRERPDLVLSDVMMPELDGLGLARELADDPTTRSIPVVLLTARSDLGTKLQGLEGGAHDYVVKPFHVEELRSRLRLQLQLRDLSVELAHRERLAILGTLVAGVAHELRNPLNGILNTVLPARELLAGGSSDVAALLDLAAVSARRVEQLSRQLLLMARAGEGPRARVDLLETVQLAARMVHGPRSSGPEIAIQAESSAPPAELRGDAGALMQVWVNLLDNAVRAAGPSGHVHVRVRTEGDDAVVDIRDDGPGLSPEVAARMFEPFYTTRPAGEGTGLGLALAHKTILDHGGRIELVAAGGNEPSAGACFRVRLPRDSLRRLEAAAQHEGQPSANTDPERAHAPR